MSKKVSIIMPAYNAQNWIKETIYNIQKQTYTNWELIIVNDGSTDDTELLCQKIAEKDNRIKVLTQSNKGPSAARNFGLSHMTGEYFTIIDCDDLLYSNALEVYLSTAQKYKADMVIAGFRTINTSTGTVYESFIPEEMCYRPNSVINTEQTERLVKAGLMASNWNKQYATDLAKLRFHTEITLNEDGLFSLTALSQSAIVAVTPVILYEYRVQNRQSVSRKFHPEFPEALAELEKQLLFGQKEKLIEGLQVWLMNYLYIHLKNICMNDLINQENKVKCIQAIVRTSLFKKYATVCKADTLNRKIAVCMLRAHLYTVYISLVRAKRR